MNILNSNIKFTTTAITTTTTMSGLTDRKLTKKERKQYALEQEAAEQRQQEEYEKFLQEQEEESKLQDEDTLAILHERIAAGLNQVRVFTSNTNIKKQKRAKEQRAALKQVINPNTDADEETPIDITNIKPLQFCSCRKGCGRLHAKDNHISPRDHYLCDTCDTGDEKPKRGCPKNHNEDRLPFNHTNLVFMRCITENKFPLDEMKSALNKQYYKYSRIINSLETYDNSRGVSPNGNLNWLELLRVFDLIESYRMKNSNLYQLMYSDTSVEHYYLMYELNRRKKLCNKNKFYSEGNLTDRNGRSNKCNGSKNCTRGCHKDNELICVNDLDRSCECPIDSVKIHLNRNRHCKQAELQVLDTTTGFHYLDETYTFTPVEEKPIRIYENKVPIKSVAEIKKEKQENEFNHLSLIKSASDYDDLCHGFRQEMISVDGIMVPVVNTVNTHFTKTVCKNWVEPIDRNDYPHAWQLHMYVNKPIEGKTDIDFAIEHGWSHKNWDEYLNHTINDTKTCLHYTFVDFHRQVKKDLYAFNHRLNKQRNWFKFMDELQKSNFKYEETFNNESYGDDGDLVVYSASSLQFDFTKARQANQLSNEYYDKYAYYLRMKKIQDERVIGDLTNKTLQAFLKEKPVLFGEFVSANIGSTFEKWLQTMLPKEYELKSQNINVSLKNINKYLNLNDTSVTLQECVENNFKSIKKTETTGTERSLLEESLIDVQKVKQDMKKFKDDKVLDRVPISRRLEDINLVRELYPIINESCQLKPNLTLIESELQKLLDNHGLRKLLIDIVNFVQKIKDEQNENEKDKEGDADSSSDSSDSSSDSDSSDSSSDSSDSNSDSSDSSSDSSDSDVDDVDDFKVFDLGFNNFTRYYERIGVIRGLNKKGKSPVLVGPLTKEEFANIKKKYKGTDFRQSKQNKINTSKLDRNELGMIKTNRVPDYLKDKLDSTKKIQIFGEIPLNPTNDIPNNLIKVIMEVLSIVKEDVYIQDDIREFNIENVTAKNEMVKHSPSKEDKVSKMKSNKPVVKNVWNDTRKKEGN